MAANTEAVIEAAGRIINLRAELATAQADLERLISAEQSNSGQIKTSADGSDDLSLNRRIVVYLDENAGRDFDAEEIATALVAANLTTVRSSLARLAEDKIRRTGRGRYASLNSFPLMEVAS